MMEPGEAEALRMIDARAGRLLVEAGHLRSAEPEPLDAFTATLLRREVFVAEDDASGEPVGFAAAADLGEISGAGGAGCYWISGLAVDPAHGRRGVGTALLGAVAARANWFFHRALGLSTARHVVFNATFYRARGFLDVPEADWTAEIRERFEAELPMGVDPADRCVMVRWL